MMATEKRLIDANALMEEINLQRRASAGSFPRRYYVVGDVLNSIRNAATVDAVEVVRCKNCKHCRISHPTGKPTPFYFCKQPKGSVVKPDDFCSYGKRRTDETL